VLTRIPSQSQIPSASASHSAFRPAIAATLAGILATSSAVPTVAQDSAAATAPAPAAAQSTAQPPTAGTPDNSGRLIESLVTRLQELERRESERAKAAENQSADLVRKLQNRIDELEGKVKALEGARVVPELSVGPDSGPTPAELDQKVRVLERKNQLAAEKARETPQVSLGASGFSFRSADTNFVLRVRGLIQGDSRHFFGDNELATDNDGILLRRSRIGLEGTVFRDFDYQLISDFGGPNIQMLDANVAYKFQPGLRLRAGRFKSPVGYEQYLSVHNIHFNERSLVTSLVPIRNDGIQLEGEALGQRLSYAAGIFTPSGDGRNAGFNDHGDDPEFAGRLFAQPFRTSDNTWLRGLQVGVSGSWSQISSNVVGLPNTIGGTRPGYLTPAGQQFFAYNSPAGTVVADGVHWRLSPFIQYLKGPFGILGEYLVSQQGVLNATTLRSENLQHAAFQVAGQWMLSGEDASWNAINPIRPFSLSDGGWGAWQLVGRYTTLDLDNDTFPAFSNPASSASSAATWAVGINWWLNRNVRILTSFSHTSFEGGGNVNPADPSSISAPATVTAQDENALMTRIQIGF
jgi:phosphate-selective porin OprO/OprP